MGMTTQEKRLLLEAAAYHRTRLGITRNPMSTILQEADAIAGERARDYAHPHTNHTRIAAFWSIQLEPILKRPILPREVALMMIGSSWLAKSRLPNMTT